VGVGGLVVGAQLATQPALDRLIGTFLLTIIHVFVFTGLFILVGALRARSLSGILSLVVFFGVASMFAVAHPTASGYQASGDARDAYGTATYRAPSCPAS